MQTHEEYLESPWQRQLNFTSIGQSKANMEHLLNNKLQNSHRSLRRDSCNPFLYFFNLHKRTKRPTNFILSRFPCL
ncbi:hypothetical protein HanLR1_Chr00c3296g0873851 [Helianthus annuus]|nr:hypothetical protein HanLR1_Chr00c3296g0873851 [Helianthus annuus]